jgi:cell filamentation protein
VRISKGDSAFCYPEHIVRQMKDLFDGLKRRNFLRNLSADEFASQATAFLATLNAIHPFREGNGRTQTTFLLLLADRADHPLDLNQLVPERFLQAMIASFEGDEGRLRSEIRMLIG